MAKASDNPAPSGDRLAKVMARAGLCSRRDAEKWIAEGRVAVNGKTIRTPAFNVTGEDTVAVDGKPIESRRATRVWLYHKPAGLVVTEKDPDGRETIFDVLAKNGMPRVLSIGRLDINTEGLLLLTNDGGLKRVLELPATGWLRRYRVRAHGKVTQQQLDSLKKGIEVDGIKYGPIEAELEREQGTNVWITLALREGKNREVKNVLGALGLQVNRLIRTSYGPFQLGDLPIGGVSAVKSRVLRDQLGSRLAREAGVDFDAPLPEEVEANPQKAAGNPNVRLRRNAESGLEAAPRRRQDDGKRAPLPKGRTGAPRPRRPGDDRPAPERFGKRPARDDKDTRAEEKPTSRVLFDDGREATIPQPKSKKPRDDKFGDDKKGGFKSGPRPPRREGDGDKPRSFGDRKDRPRPERAGKPSRRDGPGKPRSPAGGPRKGPPRGGRR